MLFTRRELKDLKRILRANINDFRTLPGAVVTETPDGPMIYIDNGADVLAVAHLDVVMENNFTINYQKSDHPIVSNCPQLDDRLGVWVLLKLLPMLDSDMKYDILLTDSEEVGASTAAYFNTEKQYRYIFEFDRAGTDLVTYQYSDDDWDRSVSAITKVGQGSFSDVSYLDHLCCKGMNIGVGYHGQHTRQCYANLADTVKMAWAFLAWAKRNSDKSFPHDPTIARVTKVQEYNQYKSYDEWYYDKVDYEEYNQATEFYSRYDKYGNDKTAKEYIYREEDDVNIPNKKMPCICCGTDTEQEYLCPSCQLDHYQAFHPEDSSWSKRYCS